MNASLPFWIVFNLIVIAIMVLDLKVVNKNAHKMTVREAGVWSAFCVALALLFNLGLYFFMSRDKALEFLTGYLIELSLSVDNLFVFLLIFDYFKVPDIYQPRVLHWGILGAIIMRFIFIFVGAALLNRFHWIIYVFGGMLIFTGVKMFFDDEEKELQPEKNLVLRVFKKLMPMAECGIPNEKFFMKFNGRTCATPLFITLLMVESTDLIFALDSIPAIFAVTRDPFIVYTSNIFAILGLRAMYFLLSSLLPLFIYLKKGISAVLCFVGVKMAVSHYYHISTGASLAVVGGVLGASVILSLLIAKKKGQLP